MKPLVLALLLTFLTLLSSISYAQLSLTDQIKRLEPVIGGWPPNIKDEETLNSIKQKYKVIKHELDAILEKQPNNTHWLFMRGHLQSMGHNINYPGAWQGATDDLKTVLNINPNNIPAIIELANLWLNSDLKLASNAEKLFRCAQCYNKKEPLEAAQRGIFFAQYYQGKMKEAFRQAEYLTKTWPNNEDYKRFKDMAQSNLKRTKEYSNLKETNQEKSVMATCDN